MNVMTPTVSVARWVDPSFETNSISLGTMRADCSENPKTFPIWPITMLMAIPFMKPTSTGLPRKSARKPSRNNPATMQATPASTASETASAVYNAASSPASGATIAATIAHAAASGLTIN